MTILSMDKIAVFVDSLRYSCRCHSDSAKASAESVKFHDAMSVVNTFENVPDFIKQVRYKTLYHIYID